MKKKKIIQFLIIIVLIFIILSLALNIIQLLGNKPQVCINEKCFQVEIAKTQAEREKGLMFRENLDEDKAMLFIFENSGIYSFWMKNTLLPLDIIWVNENKEVMFIKENAQPLNETFIIPNQSAIYVLELNAGIVNKFNISIGNPVKLIE